MTRIAAVVAAVSGILLFASSFAEAGAKVIRSEDIVQLRDGSQVKGTLLMEGARAVIMLTEAGQVAIPLEQVERVVRGPSPNKPAEPIGTSLQEDGHFGVGAAGAGQEQKRPEGTLIPTKLAPATDVDMKVNLPKAPPVAAPAAPKPGAPSRPTGGESLEKLLDKELKSGGLKNAEQLLDEAKRRGTPRNPRPDE